MEVRLGGRGLARRGGQGLANRCFLEGRVWVKGALEGGVWLRGAIWRAGFGLEVRLEARVLA